ncbi:glycoside hydrolase family 43 protein [Puniceicoccus vermicola]|uniref:Family 43 glycosylhydrolase n=1 Tax=Puniceicoccus vermicola TaxID=388746 RepID=A0A7X1AYR5_9BACT|nr:glycoside hydrolase family 43 protein [Puniceicoccus vermicola]MBC2602442.1 family 43 glycosylhydrolase [Puniceicoccus vermicola]
MSNTIHNPILPGMNPDPTVCRVGGTFYLATSSFGQFPGVPLYASEDLRHWRFVRHILSRPEQLPFREDQSFVGEGIFAPTLRHDGKNFYLVTTNIGNGGHFIVSAANPEDEWSDPVWVDAEHQGGIDPSLTFLEDGTVLFQTTGDSQWGEPMSVVQFPIDLANGRGLGPREVISPGFGWKAVEAPHIFRRGEFWYLLTAEGGTEENHRVAIGRSDSPWGPWVPCPTNPILTHAGYDSTIQNTGHADLFEDEKGNWWIVFLGVRPLGYPSVHLTGRETFLASVSWTDEGWPVVNGGEPVDISGSDEKSVSQPTGTPWTEDFREKSLSWRWVAIGATYREGYGFDENRGMILRGLSSSLDRRGKAGFIGARLSENSGRYQTSLRIEKSGTEAGICVFMDESGYYSCGLLRKPDGRCLLRLVKRVIDMETVEEFEIEGSEPTDFRVELTRRGEQWSHAQSSFVFSVRDPEQGWR